MPPTRRTCVLQGQAPLLLRGPVLRPLRRVRGLSARGRRGAGQQHGQGQGQQQRRGHRQLSAELRAHGRAFPPPPPPRPPPRGAAPGPSALLAAAPRTACARRGGERGVAAAAPEGASNIPAEPRCHSHEGAEQVSLRGAANGSRRPAPPARRGPALPRRQVEAARPPPHPRRSVPCRAGGWGCGGQRIPPGRGEERGGEGQQKKKKKI